ncbi:MAG: metallophosphoesterase [Clostridia bacterium]|nr:metallophosphoesterase [Clostridia bacterium]
MRVFKSILANFSSFIMAIILTVFPYAGFELPVINNAKENCNLTAELISDVHIEQYDVFRKAFLAVGLGNLKRAKAEINTVVVAGDLTNYADEISLAKYYEILKKHSPVAVISAAGNHDIGHVGDRGVTDISREEAKANFIKYNNEYLGTESDNNYYTMVVNGYKFIVLGDDVIDGGHWDAMDMSKEQLRFLDEELASSDGKPTFVVCHWPVDGMNGQEITYPDSSIDLSTNDIKTIMEKYKNVFYISGHSHGGIRSNAAAEYCGMSNVEQQNGVTYVSLPSFGIVNSFGYPWSGTGFQMEVYDDRVIFRARNFLTNYWFTNAVFAVEIQ